MKKSFRLLKYFYFNSFIGLCLTLTLSLASLTHLIDELKGDFSVNQRSLLCQVDNRIRYEKIALELASRLLKENLNISDVFKVLNSQFFDLYYIDEFGNVTSSTKGVDLENFQKIQFVFKNLLNSGNNIDDFYLFSLEQNKRELFMIKKDLTSKNGYLLGTMNLEKLLSDIDIDSKFVIYDDSGYVLKSNSSVLSTSENVYSKFTNQFDFLDFSIFYNNHYNIASKYKYSKDLHLLIYKDLRDITYGVYLYLFFGFLVLFFIQVIYLKKYRMFIGKHYIDVVNNMIQIVKNDNLDHCYPVANKDDDLYMLESSICNRLNKYSNFIEYIDELENRFKSFFDGNQIPMLIINPYTGQITDANSAALEFYGYKKSELIQKTIHSLNASSTSSVAYNMYEGIKNKENYIQAQHLVKRGKGYATKNIHIYSFNIHTKIKCDYLMILDFTETEKNLNWIDNEKFYFKYGPVTVLEINTQNNTFTIDYVHQKTSSLFGGNSKQDVIGKRYFDLFASGDKNNNDDFIYKYNMTKQREIESTISKINSGETSKLLEQNVYLKDKKHDDSLYKIYYRFIVDKDLKVEKIIAFIVDFDISLYESGRGKLFQEGFENSPNAVMIIDENKAVLAINERMCKLFALDKKSILENKEDITKNSKLDVNIKETIQTYLDNPAVNKDSMFRKAVGINVANTIQSVLLSIVPSKDSIQSTKAVGKHYIVGVSFMDESVEKQNFIENVCKDISNVTKIRLVILRAIGLIDMVLDNQSHNPNKKDLIDMFIDYRKNADMLITDNDIKNVFENVVKFCMGYLDDDSDSNIANMKKIREKLIEYL